MTLPRVITVALCVLTLAMTPKVAADTPSPEMAAKEELLVLPPLEVPGDFPADGWVYTRVDHTEFISQLSTGETRKLADDFVIFQQFVRANYPEAALPVEYPITVVLCKNSTSFRNFAGSNKTFTATLPNSERFILIDESQLYQVQKTIRRRWMGLAFKHQPLGKYPLWRELATKEILAALLITGDRLEIGYTPFAPLSEGVKWLPRLGGGLQPLTYSKQFNILPGSLPSFEKLFTLERRSPEYDEIGFYATMEAAAFMHQCQFGLRQHQFRKPFVKFITRLETEPFSEKLFYECFAKSTKDMEWLLRDYIFSPSLKYESKRYKISPTLPFEVRPAKPVEVLRLLRECQRLLALATAEKTARPRP